MVEVTVALMRGSLAAALSEPAPTADAENADAPGIDIFAGGQVIDRRAEIFRADFGRSEVAGRAAALSVKRGVECDGQKAALGEGLRITARNLLFHRPVRAADRDGGQASPRILRFIHVCGERDAVTVVESDFRVFHSVALREGLVPLLR